MSVYSPANTQRLFFSFLLAVTYSLFQCSNSLAQSTEEATLRELSNSFYKTYEHKDSLVTLKLWHAQSPSLATFKQQIEKLFASSGKIELTRLSVRQIEMESQTGKVRVEIEMVVVDLKSAKPLAEWSKTQRVLIWQKETERWKLWNELSAHEDLAKKLLAIPQDDERRRLLANESELATTDLAREINTIALRNGNSTEPDYSFVTKSLQLSYEIALQAGDRVRASNTLHNLSTYYYRQGNYAESINAGEKAVEMRTAINNQNGVAQSLVQAAASYAELGRYTEAKSRYERALQLRETLGDLQPLAQTLNEYGTWYYEQGDYDKALELYRRALQIREARQQQNPKDAENTNGLFNLQNNIGLVYAERGDHITALNLFNQSLSIILPQGRDIGRVLQYIGSVHSRQGNYELALQYYQKALQANQQQADPVFIVRTLNHIGDIYHEQNQPAQALDYFRRARELIEPTGNLNLLYRTLNSSGLAYATQRDYTEALNYLQRSLTICEQLDTREGIAETNHLIAAMYYNQAAFERAVPYIERAVASAVLIEKPELWQRVYTSAGQIYQATRQPEKARQAFLAAIAAIERLRLSVAGGEQQRQAFFENKTAPYQELTELLLAQNNSAEAFRYAEKAKARALLDVLQSGKSNPAKALTAAEQVREGELSNQLTLINSQLYKEQTRQSPSKERQAELSAQLEKTRLDYEDFRTRLYATHPELKVQRGEAKTITMEEAAALLPDEKTAFLNYVVGPERVQLFVITKGNGGSAKLRVYPLEIKREVLAEQVEQFRSQLAGRDAQFGKLAQKLYSSLLKPAQAELPPQAKLMIVPDGPLWELPFQALLTAQGHYLWEDHVIAYAPSLTVLREMTKAKQGKGKAPAAQSLFAIGDPALGTGMPERAKSLMGGAIEQLPEARTQVEALQKFYDANRSKVFIGEAAEEATVKAEAGKFSILHFAAHGVLNNRSPLYSYIVLAQPTAAQSAESPKQAKEDGLLEAWEVMQMDLQADLAVLSACETARGRVGAGEGMIGLTWALFIAGVPTTVVSQWQVRADKTADLMVEFHRQLQRPGMRNAQASRPATEWTKAEALRLAALKILHNGQFRHPFYWAGFVLVGQPR